MTTLSKQGPLSELRLRFFDLEARIRSDSTTYIDLFARMYHRFRPDLNRLDADQPAAPHHLDVTVLTGPDNEWGQPVLILDEDVRPISDPIQLEGFIYEIIFLTMIARVRSHVLIHAGAVARDGQGIILAADSAHGKTTLVLELVRRGFYFLSDEMAALGRADRQVHPFPRCLRLRLDTLDRVGHGPYASS